MRCALPLMLLLAAGCGGGQPKQDAGKSDDQVRAELAQMSTADIQKTIEEYKRAIRAKLDAAPDPEKGRTEAALLMRRLSLYQEEIARRDR